MIQDLLLPFPIFALGAILLFIYIFKDKTRKYSILILVSLALSALGVIAEQMVLDFPFLSETFLICAAILYFLRFAAYEQKRGIDWFKISLVILYVIIDILEMDVYINVVGAGLACIYVFDKTQYSNILNQNWKTAVSIAFGLSIVSTMALLNLNSEEEMALRQQCVDQFDELNKLRSELVICKTDVLVLNRELKELQNSE